MFNHERIKQLEERVTRLEDSKSFQMGSPGFKEADVVDLPFSEERFLIGEPIEETKEINYEKKGTFGWALQQLKKGKTVSRMKHIKKTPSYLFKLESEIAQNPVILMQFDNKEVFWIPDTEDLLAEDWLLVDRYDINNCFDKVVKTMIIPDISEKLLNFREAFKLMREEDLPIKHKSFNGYWKWSEDTILMFCADNKIIDIRETKYLRNTINFILDDNWEIATEANCSIPIV